MNERKKKVVVMGGGNGAAISLLALKQNADNFDISAIISMSDSGGSSGKLRKEFNTVPTGDIMRAILSLSPYDYKILKKIFYENRFSGIGKLDVHNVGNLFLTLAEQYGGDFISGIRALSQAVESIGYVYPATLDNTHLNVKLANGEIVKTEAAIDSPSYDKSIRIKEAWLEPDGDVYSQASSAIKDADAIILGPGSLYTSVIASLLPRGMSNAIADSKSKIFFVAGNAYHIYGETGPKLLSEFARELQRYLPRHIDTVIYNTQKLNKLQQENYKKRGWALFENDPENLSDYAVIGRDFENEDGGLSSELLGRIFMELL